MISDDYVRLATNGEGGRGGGGSPKSLLVLGVPVFHLSFIIGSPKSKFVHWCDDFIYFFLRAKTYDSA